MSEEIEEANVEFDAEEVNNFATVGAVYSDGVSLIFDAQQEEGASEKHYKCNSGIRISAGDRVKLLKDSGTYVVEYVVGEPGDTREIPSGGSSGQVLMKTGSGSNAYEWRTFTISGTLPTGGTTGQYLVKNSSTNYDAKWQTLSVSGTLPAGGSTGQFLKKSSYNDYACSWASGGLVPAGGSTGQYLKKSSTTDYSLTWGDAPDVSRLYQSSTNLISLNTSRQLIPYGSSSTYSFSIGSSSYPFWSAYFGGGTIQIGSNSSSTNGTKIGFYGTTPIVRQVLSTTSNNMGYTSATSSNYLYILNNIAGILKNKLGLIG